MKRHFLRREILQFGLGSAVAWPQSLHAAAPGASGLVTGHAEGAEAGNAVLAAGGNAVDAIVTAALVAGVVAVPGTGIAGYGGHLVLAKSDGAVAAIDFNSTAPAAAKAEMFNADESGRVAGNAHLRGWLAAGVPGVLAGLQLALDKHGTKRFPELAKPAIRYARDGFAVKKNLAAAIAAASKQFEKDAGSTKLFLKNGKPPAEGETFRNPDLAALLERLAEKGRVDDFYTGNTAAKIAAAFKANGGLVTQADLANYCALEVKPLSTTWGDGVVHTPAPASAGLTVLQAINTLSALGWAKLDHTDPGAIQSKIDALRIAWTDRLKFLGDPKFADVPVERLLSQEYAKESAERVRAAVKAKKPVEGKSDGRTAGGTVHLNAIDRTGLTVALTFTHGESFGAQVVVDGLGLVLGHGVSRFDPRPGRANSIAPGKRPLHNMSPTIVTRNGEPWLALGATGGRRIPNAVFDVLSQRVGRDLPLAEAVKAPRLHTEGDPALTLEPIWSDAALAQLKSLGYEVKTGPLAVLNAIERNPATGEVASAAR